MKFTKTYKIEINEKQKAALVRAFKTLVSYILNEEKKDVEVIVDKFDGERIIAKMVVGGAVIEARVIGLNGGLTVV
jgi:phenylpyruvate tautomerase PptA (4-oxalocrotonate tautomerase family)